MPRKKIVQAGDKFGFWMVLSESGKSNSGKILYRCECICKRVRDIPAGNLFSGRSSNCGCQRKENIKPSRKDHSGAWSSWKSMKTRCKSKYFKHKKYKELGYCSEWENFEAFFNDMGDRPEGMSLDRIDNNKGYSKENCRWATRAIQDRNSSRTHWITYKGKTQCLTDWAREYGMPVNKLSNRINRQKWDIDRALNEP